MRSLAQLILATALLFFGVLLQPTFSEASCETQLEPRFLFPELDPRSHATFVAPVFSELYGSMAEPAAIRLRGVSPTFSRLAQVEAYDFFWAKKTSISLKEKSLATLASLMARGLYPQIRLHVNGFLSQGGTLEELSDLVGLISRLVQRETIEISREVDRLCDAAILGLEDRKVLKRDQIRFRTLSHQSQKGRMIGAWKSMTLPWSQISAFAAAVAAPEKIPLRYVTHEITGLLQGRDPIIAEKTLIAIQEVGLHLIVYCGYLRAFRGLQTLQLGARLHHLDTSHLPDSSAELIRLYRERAMGPLFKLPNFSTLEQSEIIHDALELLRLKRNQDPAQAFWTLIPSFNGIPSPSLLETIEIILEGNAEKMRELFGRKIQEGVSRETIDTLIAQTIPLFGYPSAMNAYLALQAAVKPH